jgi:5-methylcytosine-specific restriction endonuclease McrA
MEKYCKKHGLTDFSNKSGYNSGRCRKCLVEAVTNSRRKLKQKSVQYKGGKCNRCGYNKCLDALEFHHIDRSDKEFGIGTKGATRAWEKLKIELDKCELLCSNCHKEEHSIGN